MHSQKTSIFVIVGLLSVSTLIGKPNAGTGSPYTASFHSMLIDDGHDLIFPSIIHASEHFENPLAEYYLYTSPHGGADIRLYFADSIEGPWSLHKTVVDDQVARAPHVSSPHAVWNEKADALFLYVHAPNAQTVYCHSKDGINFEYGDVCVTSKMISETLPFASRSASYARIHKYKIPEYDNTWTLTVTASGRNEDKTIDYNAIVLCTSNDGIEWTVRRSIIDDGNQGSDYKAMDGCWIPIDGRNYMIYALRSQAEEGTDRVEPVRLHISEGDKNWRNWEYKGIFYEPKSGLPDKGAARGFSWLLNKDEPILLYEAGQNRMARIARLHLTKGTITQAISK